MPSSRARPRRPISRPRPRLTRPPRMVVAMPLSRRSIATGSGLKYSTYLGGSAADAGTGIAVDNSGYAVVTGTTSSAAGVGSTGFPTTSGALQSSYGGSQDAFVTRSEPVGHGAQLFELFGRVGVRYRHRCGDGRLFERLPFGLHQLQQLPHRQPGAGKLGRGDRCLDNPVVATAGAASIHRRHQRRQHLVRRGHAHAKPDDQRHGHGPVPP